MLWLKMIYYKNQEIFHVISEKVDNFLRRVGKEIFTGSDFCKQTFFALK